MIIIDPGHGGPEPDQFRIAPDGTREAEINLRVALGLATKLEHLGLDFRLTRSTDVKVSLEDRIKNLEIHDLFVSIHHNSYDPPETESSFPLVYVDEAYSLLGTSLLSSFEKYHPRKGSCINSRAVFDTGIFVLVNSPCPSVLGEFDFFSSCCHLRKKFFEHEIAAYLDFILNYLQGYLNAPTPINNQDISKIQKLYSQPPPWNLFLTSYNPQMLKQLSKQNKIIPLVGRIHVGVENYYA